jgi:hypothetical protein
MYVFVDERKEKNFVNFYTDFYFADTGVLIFRWSNQILIHMRIV